MVTTCALPDQVDGTAFRNVDPPTALGGAGLVEHSPSEKVACRQSEKRIVAVVVKPHTFFVVNNQASQMNDTGTLKKSAGAWSGSVPLRYQRILQPLNGCRLA